MLQKEEKEVNFTFNKDKKKTVVLCCVDRRSHHSEVWVQDCVVANQ